MRMNFTDTTFNKDKYQLQYLNNSIQRVSIEYASSVWDQFNKNQISQLHSV